MTDQLEGGEGKRRKLKLGKQLCINVIQRPWRVVYRLNGFFEPQTIKCTLEAESRIKARLKASDEAKEIASLLGVEPDNVVVESVTRIYPSSE